MPEVQTSCYLLAVAFDEANITTALNARPADFRYVFNFGVEAQVFFEVVLRDEISPHHVEERLSIFYNNLGAAFDEFAEAV